MGHDSVAVIEFDSRAHEGKLKLSLYNTFSKEHDLTLIFNKDFGIRVITESDDYYSDIDLQLGKVTTKLYITTFKQKVYISANGLTFQDIIYSGDFPSKFLKSRFWIRIDEEYSTVPMASIKTKILATEVDKQASGLLTYLEEPAHEKLTFS